MIRKLFALGAMLLVGTGCAQAEPAGDDNSEAFKVAGFRMEAGKWHKCDDPGTASYTPGSFEEVGDLNGDGLPEAVITEGSAYCYGNTGTAFSLVSRDARGWKLTIESVGIPNFLDTKGADGWPDIEVGGPGFCFPVMRWDGRAYRHIGNQYEGKSCNP